MVSGPSLPINIIKIESSLLPSQRPPVIPVESPTVPKALTISKAISRSGISGSITHIKYIPISTTEMPIITIIAALRNASCGIEYLNAFSDSFVAADLTPLSKTKNVVVFIPPRKRSIKISLPTCRTSKKILPRVKKHLMIK